MWCRKCNVIMSITGTSYHQKENRGDKGYKRYNKCPNCGYKKFNNGLNFQEVIEKEIRKSKIG